jgi:genome maintenance exonuclease 1
MFSFDEGRINYVHRSISFPTIVKENRDGIRVYATPDGNRYPSVTTVLADFGAEKIQEWRKAVGEEKANKISKAATDRGTNVHLIIEKYLGNEDLSEVEMLPKGRSIFGKMRKELNKLNNIHCIEQPLFSHELQLAGTVDCIAEYNGVLSIVDWKTSTRLKKKEDIKSYFMQGTAYSIMYEEMTGTPIDQVVIIIGVETADFCQVMKVSPQDYKPLLIEQIENWRNKNGSR